MGRRYLREWNPAHPLAFAAGEVPVHRRVLYDALGAGTHPCHWCQRPVTWAARRQRGVSTTELVTDHLNGDRHDNRITNLLPSCMTCNRDRVSGHIVKDHELYVVRPDGTRLRAAEVVCAACGTAFLRARSRVRPESFCGRACAAAGKRRRHATCPAGHDLSGSNAYTHDGRVTCRACRSAATARYNAANRARRTARERERRARARAGGI